MLDWDSIMFDIDLTGYLWLFIWMENEATWHFQFAGRAICTLYQSVPDMFIVSYLRYVGCEFQYPGKFLGFLAATVFTQKIEFQNEP